MVFVVSLWASNSACTGAIQWSVVRKRAQRQTFEDQLSWLASRGDLEPSPNSSKPTSGEEKAELQLGLHLLWSVSEDEHENQIDQQ